MRRATLTCTVAAALVASAWGIVSVAGQAAQSKTAPQARKPSRPEPPGITESARRVYALQWGVSRMSAQLAESGQLVRFNYYVTDAAKAASLNDKASTPYLLDEKAHAVLQVPTMEKVGPLRQSNTAETGKSYWMVFSNKGYVVKPGHSVSIVIGRFRVDKLIVE